MGGAGKRKRGGVAEPWYAGGVRFTCLPDCGRCCTRHDEHAYVYLELEDVRALSRFLDVPVADFRRRFTFREDGHTALRIDGDACPFLDGSRCAVYAARPRQCRIFPFWKESLRSREAWEAQGAFCPGVGQGDWIPLETLRARSRGES